MCLRIDGRSFLPPAGAAASPSGRRNRAALGELQRKQYVDGTGDLVFARDTRGDSDGDRRVTGVGFLAIRDVNAVEEWVRALSQKGEK